MSKDFTHDLLISLEKARYWLLNSGTYIIEKNDRNYGGLYSYFHYYENKNEHIYPEVTGYIISLLRYLHSIYGDGRLVELARASGDWLIQLAERYEGTVIIGIENGIDIKQSQSFDLGIVCKGLLDLYELVKDEKYLQYAEKMADTLVNAMNPDGSVKPMLYSGSDVIRGEGEWWMESGSFHSKIAMSLLQLFSINNNKKFLEAATKICEWTLTQQQADGSFSVNRYNTSVNLHAHCYTIEALLYAYGSLRRIDFLHAIEKAADWMRRMQAPNGSLWLWYNGGIPGIWPSYAIAQFVRISALLFLINPRQSLLDAAIKSSRFLFGMQASSADAKINGGFYEFFSDYDQFNVKPFAIGSWSTMFAIQAFEFLYRKDAINFDATVMTIF